jgi:hypothetical protein
VLFDRAIDAAYRLRVESELAVSAGVPRIVIRATLMERQGTRSWELLSFDDVANRVYQVERVTARVLVLSWVDEPYGSTDGHVKFFLDLDRKHVDKRIEYQQAAAVEFATDAESRSTLGVRPAELQQLRAAHVFGIAKPEAATPPLFAQFPLPQSSTRDVIEMRPHFRASGLTAADIGVGETVGPFQSDRDGFWFGKSFYDAEGDTGIGAIGRLDGDGRYQFLRIAELRDWSVSAILVDGDIIWAGLTHHGEGHDYSGGLLRHDRRTGRTIVHAVPDIVHTIVRRNAATFVGTDRGVYVVRAGGTTRYRMEPDITGRLVAVSQHATTIPPRPEW